MQVAKMGMLNVTLWDYDQIESHNIPNQIYSNSSIGLLKVDEMQRLIKDSTGLVYDTRGKWKGEKLEGLVFSCVDSMSARKRILSKVSNGIFIETRMGVYHGQIFCIDPADKEQVAFWHSHWCGDDVIEEKSACGSSLTIGSTAQLLSSIASWQGIYYMREEPLSRGITVSTKPYLLMEM